jgi:hypothetical protein
MNLKNLNTHRNALGDARAERMASISTALVETLRKEIQNGIDRKDPLTVLEAVLSASAFLRSISFQLLGEDLQKETGKCEEMLKLADGIIQCTSFEFRLASALAHLQTFCGAVYSTSLTVEAASDLSQVQ